MKPDIVDTIVDVAAEAVRRDLGDDLLRRLRPVLLKTYPGDLLLVLDGGLVLADYDGEVGRDRIRDVADALMEILGARSVLEEDVPPEVTRSGDWTYGHVLSWWDEEQRRRDLETSEGE